MILLDITAIVCMGLLAGAEFAVSAFVNPVLWRLDGAAQPEAVRLFARRLGAAMPFWYVAGLLLLGAETFLRRHGAGAGLLGAAIALWAGAIVLSLVLLVPINNRMAQLRADTFSEAARREHRRWDRLHRLRVAALVAALVLFLAAR